MCQRPYHCNYIHFCVAVVREHIFCFSWLQIYILCASQWLNCCHIAFESVSIANHFLFVSIPVSFLSLFLPDFLLFVCLCCCWLLCTRESKIFGRISGVYLPSLNSMTFLVQTIQITYDCICDKLLWPKRPLQQFYSILCFFPTFLCSFRCSCAQAQLQQQQQQRRNSAIYLKCRQRPFVSTAKKEPTNYWFWCKCIFISPSCQ